MGNSVQANGATADGDHSYAGVKADFVNYLSAVKRGGYIIFDDYDAPEWPGVKEFVDTYVRGNPDVGLVGTSGRTAVFRVVRKTLANKQLLRSNKTSRKRRDVGTD